MVLVTKPVKIVKKIKILIQVIITLKLAGLGLDEPESSIQVDGDGTKRERKYIYKSIVVSFHLYTSLTMPITETRKNHHHNTKNT